MRKTGFLTPDKIIITAEAVKEQRKSQDKSYLEKIEKVKKGISSLEQKKADLQKDIKAKYLLKESQLSAQEQELEELTSILDEREYYLEEQEVRFKNLKKAWESEKLDYLKEIAFREKVIISKAESLSIQLKRSEEAEVNSKKAEQEYRKEKNALTLEREILKSNIEEFNKEKNSFQGKVKAFENRVNDFNKERDFIKTERALLEDKTKITKEKIEELKVLRIKNLNQIEEINQKREEILLITKRNKEDSEYNKKYSKELRDRELFLTDWEKASKVKDEQQDKRAEILRLKSKGT